MPISTAQSTPAAVSPSVLEQPENITQQLLDRAAMIAGEKGVPKNAFLFVYIALREGWVLDTLHPPQVQEVAGCQLSTAKTILAWVRKHNLLPLNNLDDEAKNLAHVCSSNSKEALVQNIHDTEFWPADPALHLAVEQLAKLGFNEFEKEGGGSASMARRFERIVAWVQKHGAMNVLYLLHRIECQTRTGKLRLRKPAAFLRSEIRNGKKAPDGWIHPELRVLEDEPVEENAMVPPAVPSAPQPVLEVPDDWSAVYQVMEEQIRPQSFNTFIRPTDLIPGEEEGTVECWVTSRDALDFIREKLGKKLQEAFISTGLFKQKPRLEFRVKGTFQGILQ